MTSDVTHLWACDKAIFRIGINKQTKNASSQQNPAFFFWKEQIRKIKII